MGQKPEYLNWLKKTTEKLTTIDGKQVEVFQFQCPDDKKVLSAWACHFRNHFCPDSMIDEYRSGPSLSRKEYLNTLIFPNLKNPPGPSVRSGDFSEILVLDYMEYILNFWVPRFKYLNKPSPNESIKGVDLLGFKFLNNQKDSPGDVLIAFETKAEFTSKFKGSKLQDAIDHSMKDQVRKGITLNYYYQKYDSLGKEIEKRKIERFQNNVDRPYTELSGAAALISTNLYDPELLATTDASTHPNLFNLMLIIIRCDNFMDLVHDLYRRAADEA